jgi:hypothetical protein
MLYHWLANLVVVVHLAFVLLVVFGVVLVRRWPRFAWVHLPVASWGMLIEFAGWTCPLTPLENYLRRLAGQSGYAGGFIEHYVTALIYPAGLSRRIQIGLGVAVIVINLAGYWWLWSSRGRRTS